MEVCKPTGEKTILAVNALFHSAILFTFLSVFYMVYGSKIETKVSNKKFAGLMSKNIGKMLNEANRKSGGELKRGMAFLNPVWGILEKDYQKPDPTVKTYNTWLFRSATMLASFMLVSLGIILIVLKMSCGQCPTSFIWDIVAENAVIFSAVGAVEYMFFKNVALKMIPAPPSLMVNEVVKKIKDGIF